MKIIWKTSLAAAALLPSAVYAAEPGLVAAGLKAACCAIALCCGLACCD